MSKKIGRNFNILHKAGIIYYKQYGSAVCVFALLLIHKPHWFPLSLNLSCISYFPCLCYQISAFPSKFNQTFQLFAVSFTLFPFRSNVIKI